MTKPRKLPRGIIVENSIVGHWAVGAELLITAHSPQWDDHQVRSIVSIEPSPEDDKHVVVTLDSPIARPTTFKESPDYAVEVALLSRNILFEGGPDSVAHRGGHFWVMNTPGVSQTLVGLEVRRFGQQGYLGRYPIHLHFCGDSGKTTIAKNTIRHSNQRCVVVHGTNKLNIRENIAYDTKGHCFMLEDGMETDNQFMYNLGAQTGIPDNIIPNEGPNGNETDYDPSTFWITNPSNTFVGNVAAGSESSGFWFELLVRGERAHLFKDLNPKIAPLGQFRDNVAHSCLGVSPYGPCSDFSHTLLHRKRSEHTPQATSPMKKQFSWDSRPTGMRTRESSFTTLATSLLSTGCLPTIASRWILTGPKGSGCSVQHLWADLRPTATIWKTWAFPTRVDETTGLSLASTCILGRTAQMKTELLFAMLHSLGSPTIPAPKQFRFYLTTRCVAK